MHYVIPNMTKYIMPRKHLDSTLSINKPLVPWNRIRRASIASFDKIKKDNDSIEYLYGTLERSCWGDSFAASYLLLDCPILGGLPMRAHDEGSRDQFNESNPFKHWATFVEASIISRKNIDNQSSMAPYSHRNVIDYLRTVNHIESVKLSEPHHRVLVYPPG